MSKTVQLEDIIQRINLNSPRPAPEELDNRELVITPEGELVFWWSPVLDGLLEELGIPATDSSRNPWCG